MTTKAIQNTNETQPIKIKKNKYAVPRKITFNNFPNSGRTNEQILRDILLITERHKQPQILKQYLSDMIKFPISLPQINKGIKFTKSDLQQERKKLKETPKVVTCASISKNCINLPSTLIQIKLSSSIHLINILIDTCSTTCIISEDFLIQNKQTYNKATYNLETVSSQTDNILVGNITLPFYFTEADSSQKHEQEFIVAKSTLNILGYDFLTKNDYNLTTYELILNQNTKREQIIPQTLI